MRFFAWVALLELSNELVRMHLISIFPLVIGTRVSEPLDEVLQVTPSSETARVQDGLDLELLFVINQLRWGALVIVPMHLSLVIRGQQVDVEYWMNAPLMGEFEPIRDGGHHLRDSKRPMTSRGQLASWLVRLEIAPIKLHAIPYLVFGRITVFHPQLLRPSHVG